MKQHIILVLCSASLLSSCATNSTKKAYEQEMASQGLIPYNPPQGNPTGAYDWYQYGPGTIVRPSDGRNVTTADTIVGVQGVNRAKERITYYGIFSGKRYSKNSIDLSGSLASAGDAVKSAEATLNTEGIEASEVEFINPRISKPYSISYMRQRLTASWSQLDATTIKELKSGKAVVVHDVVIADGLRFYFKKSNSVGASGNVTLTSVQKLALEAKGISTFEGGIDVNQPCFVAYRKLD